MKKVVVSLVFAGILLGSAPLDAAVSKMRAVKCAIPRLHAKFNCTDEEKAVGRKWLKGATIAAAVAALAALVVGGVKLAEVQAEKNRLRNEESERRRSELLRKSQEEQEAIDTEKAKAFQDQLSKIVDNPRLLTKPGNFEKYKSAYFLENELQSMDARRELRKRLDALFAIKDLSNWLHAAALQRARFADPSTSQLQKEYSQSLYEEEAERRRKAKEKEEQKQLKKLQRAAGAEGTSDSGQEGGSSPGDMKAAQVLIANYKRRVSPLAQELVSLVEVFEISNYDEQMFSRLLSAHPAKLQEIKAMIERMSIEQSLKQKMLAGIEAKTKIPQKQKEKVRAYA